MVWQNRLNKGIYCIMDYFSFLTLEFVVCIKQNCFWTLKKNVMISSNMLSSHPQFYLLPIASMNQLYPAPENRGERQTSSATLPWRLSRIRSHTSPRSSHTLPQVSSLPVQQRAHGFPLHSPSFVSVVFIFHDRQSCWRRVLNYRSTPSFVHLQCLAYT